MLLFVHLSIEGAVYHLMYQARLARARDAGDGDHYAERNFNIDVLEIVCARAEEANGSLGIDLAPIEGA